CWPLSWLVIRRGGDASEQGVGQVAGLAAGGGGGGGIGDTQGDFGGAAVHWGGPGFGVRIFGEASAGEDSRPGGGGAGKGGRVGFAPGVPAKGDGALEEDDLAVAGFDADVQERVDANDGCPP